jgi:hypothetical protein
MHQTPAPELADWLTRRQNGEDTSDIDAMFGEVPPLQPYTMRLVEVTSSMEFCA